MIANARYTHTNIIAHDWRALAAFYENVFGCVPVPPERHYPAETLEKGTGLVGASLHGVHLRLPGADGAMPTLEIYTYSVLADSARPEVNRPGFGHIAFAVPDVGAALREVLAAGGSAVGAVSVAEPGDGSRVTWCYARDPEGNIIELQSWS